MMSMYGSGFVEELYANNLTCGIGQANHTRRKTAHKLGVAFFMCSLAAAISIASCSQAAPVQTARARTYGVAVKSENPRQTILFGDARNNVSLRQPYLDGMVGEHGLPEYVVGVSYVDTQEEWDSMVKRGYKPGKEVQMATELDIIMDGFGKGVSKSRVLVLPGAFEADDINNEKDFESILFEKEFGNARAVYSGFGSFGIEKFEVREKPGVYDIDLLVSVIELYGYKGLVDNIDDLTKRGISEQKRRSIYIDYMVHYAGLWEHDNVSRASSDFLKLEYFQPWMKRMGKSFGIEADGAWYLTNTQGKRLHLPESVKTK